MPAGQINKVSINMLRNLNISQNSQNKAVRITGVKSRSAFLQFVSQNNAITPQDIGNMARRISVRDNQFKSPQDRFLDMIV